MPQALILADLLVQVNQLVNANTEQAHVLLQQAERKDVELREALERDARAKVALSEANVEVAAAHTRLSRMEASEKILVTDRDQLDVCRYPNCQVSSIQRISQHPASWRTAFAFCKFGCRTCKEHIIDAVSERLTILEDDPCAVTTCIECNCGEPFTQIELEHVLPREAPQLFKAAEFAVLYREAEAHKDRIEELQSQADLAKTCATCFAVDTRRYVCQPCGHEIACSNCVADVWVQQSESCFVCRAPLTGPFL